MPSLATTLTVLMAVVAGVTTIRLLQRGVGLLTRRHHSFSLSEVFTDDRVVEHIQVVWLAVPLLVGGMLLVFWPGTNGAVAGAAGFFAAFLDVWPIYRYPAHLLGEGFQRVWPTVKLLGAASVGMSAVVTYLGFMVVDRIVPVAGTMSRARAWERVLDGLSASALYAPVKYGVAALFVLGAVFFNRALVRVAAKLPHLKHKAGYEKH